MTLTLRTKTIIASAFMGASAYGIGNAISSYLYPESKTLQDLFAQLAILLFMLIIASLYLNKLYSNDEVL